MRAALTTCCAVLCCLADTFIQKTKKLYLDTRTQRNISKLNEDIAEVHQIMTRNIAEVLGHGERLDRAPSPPCPPHMMLTALPPLRGVTPGMKAAFRGN